MNPFSFIPTYFILADDQEIEDSILMIFPLSASLFITLISSLDGDGSPDG